MTYVPVHVVDNWASVAKQTSSALIAMCPDPSVASCTPQPGCTSHANSCHNGILACSGVSAGYNLANGVVSEILCDAYNFATGMVGDAGLGDACSVDATNTLSAVTDASCDLHCLPGYLMTGSVS